MSAQFNTEGKETKVIMSVDEFDRYREMERAIKERKTYRIWVNNGFYGHDFSYSIVEESQVIDELKKKIDVLNNENIELQQKLNKVSK